MKSHLGFYASLCLAVVILTSMTVCCAKPVDAPDDKAPASTSSKVAATKTAEPAKAVQPAKAAQPAKTAPSPASAQPDPNLGPELLKNPSFEAGTPQKVEEWSVLPASVGGLEQTGATDGQKVLRLAPIPPDKKGYSTLQQAIELAPDSTGKTLTAQVKIKDATAKQAGLALLTKSSDGKETRLGVVDTAAEGDWETLSLKVQVPEMVAGDKLLFRVVLRPGATKPILIDAASARLPK